MTPEERRRICVAISGLAVIVGGLYELVNFDDPYITFRYARNWADGNGFVFNTGERVMGTTAPFYALILGAGALAGIDIPFLAGCMTVASIALVGILIFRLLEHEGHAVAGAVAGLIIVTHPLIGDTQGFELNFFFAFVFGGAWSYRKGRPGVAGLLLALATLTRADGCVPAGLIGCHALFSDRRAFWAFVITFALPVSIAATAAYDYFGHPLPGTLEAKRAMGQSGFWRNYLYGGARVAALYLLVSPLMVGVLVLAAIGAKRTWHDRTWLACVLAFWAVTVAGTYTILGIPSAYHYYTQFVPCLAVLAGLGAEHVRARLAEIHPRAFHAAVAILIVAQIWPAHRGITNPEPRFDLYREAAEHLAVHVDPEHRVAAVEIGIVGYFSGVRVLDLVGLTEPRVRARMAEGDVAWAVRELRPEYLLFHDPPWQSIETGIVDTEDFDDRYGRIHTFSGERPFRMALYRRK